ncbi:hypothetical protein IAR55_002362 [Kwoniella newhampshirensis]|uniref:Transglutaminase-like domain-containing protein n=1 Tax=Kwoniella newhampshirensis TaxID=1651941 RepID=A0AAW0Z0W6_9TREE
MARSGTSTSTSSSLLHQTQYIVQGLISGRYQSIPTFFPPSALEIRHARRSWAELWRSHAEDVEAFLRRIQGRREMNGDMMRVLEGLKGHCLPLELDPSMNVPITTLSSLIPDLKVDIDTLLDSPPFRPFSYEDAHVLALCQWFKSSFMRWIDPVPCPRCSGPTHAVGSVSPTDQERSDGAERVELHECDDEEGCGGKRRFGRYGKIGTLLRTREGRCGEWAHLFYVFLRTIGIKARYIWNSEDHVWCEYWSPSQEHWVHVDSCEGATNRPLLYARGWGKKQAFCLAFGQYGAEDVTRAYVDDFHGACRQRRRAKGWKEAELRRALYACTVALRLRMSGSQRSSLEEMDHKQSLWINDEDRRSKEAESVDLGGRVSGPEDWRAMRDEMGLVNEVKKPAYKVKQLLQTRNEDLSIFGNASLVGDTILLTSSSSQTSAVFHPNSLSQTASYRVKLSFRLISPPGAGEADGIALVFTSEKGLGLGGYGLGYSGVGGRGDFAVEIDTYRSQDKASDPPTPHISVHSPPDAHHRHSIACTSPNSIPFLSDGRVYDLEVLYYASSRRLRGFLGLPAGQGELELFDVNVSEGEGKDWFVGVTGSCGGLWQKQEILEWLLEEIEFAHEVEGQSLEGLAEETDDL